MDDPSVREESGPPFDRLVVHVPRAPGGLPLARARNTGARAALAAGASVVVFLDVDCIPSPGLVEAYVAAADDPATRDDLLCGPVAYLPPPPAAGYDLDGLDALAEPHAARQHHELFWSLSFAVTASTWEALGGFDERYVGYGGEDTDFALRAARSGTALAWIGSARAFHQHHPVSSPPVEHVVDIVRNARIFHDTWGRWPMTGWLDAFERRGLVGRLADGSYVVRETADGSVPICVRTGR
jgi:N-acetylglucosaminyl-diphospho-decaprenol L-rhamnosyltransferase